MKHNIIKTNEYLLVCDDSEIKVGDYIYDLDLQKIVIANDLKAITSKSTNCWYYKKIIAHLPLKGTPILNGVPLLPSIPKEDDVQKLADEASQKFKRNDELDDLILGVSANSFVEGYNKNNEKHKFTEEDLVRAWTAGKAYWGLDFSFENWLINYKEIHQQLKDPIAFECKMIKWVDELYCMVVEEHKTITNSEGRVEWVGNYIFE